MLKQSYISSKISIASVENNNLNWFISGNFYLKYSSFTLKALNKRFFQEFLIDMLKVEKIHQKSIHSIRIEILPLLRNNGVTIAGKCNTNNGKIRIYPKTLKFCNSFRKIYGKYLLIEYAGNRARVALIHELLHLKYGSDEVIVRQLTKKYYSKLIENEYTCSSKELDICNLIFAR